jgi:hypothetical protein
MVPMRIVLIPFLCLLVGACSFLSDVPPLEIGPQPDQDQLKGGIATAINELHFAKPVEVTDLFRAPVNLTEQWMVCIRSATTDEARRLTYSVFYGKNSSGKDGQYVKSRYSTLNDNCTTKEYHNYQ